MIGKALSIAIVVLALNIESFAQSEAQVPDISGVYRSGRADSPCGRGANFARNPDCPVNDLGIAAFAKATPETDPGLECVADGLSRHFTRLPRPMEIIQTDDRIIMHYATHAGRILPGPVGR